MVGIPVSVVGLGLAAMMALRTTTRKPADSLADELQAANAAGIQLAQNQSARQFALSETVPEAKPEPKTVTKRGAGPKAVRSNTPTVKAAPEPVAADVVEEIPDLTVMQNSTAPTPVEATAPSIPRPSPATQPAPSEQDGAILRGGNGSGTGRTGTGAGGGWGGIFGAVIRGGGVDGDNCDPRPGSRGPQSRGGVTVPVYGGNPSSGSMGRQGGSVIRGGGITLPIGIAGAMGTGSRPRGR
jgi:hypothetical protein